MEMFGFFVIWFLLCIGVAALANSRGRSGIGYFLLSFFLSPLLGLIVVLVTRNRTEEAAIEAERIRQEDRREFDRKREHEKQLESLKVLANTQSKHSESSPKAQPASLADELTKLAQLRDQNILTPEEFEQQKRLLLAKGL